MDNVDYSKYSSEQLLEDEFFLESQLHPTEESIRFWNEVQRGNGSLKREIACANTILQSIPFRHAKFTYEDQKNGWNRLSITNQQNKRKLKQKQLIRYFSVAASVAVLLMVGWLYYADSSVSDRLSEIEKVEKPVAPKGNIQLILADKDELTIDGDDSQLQYDDKGALSVNSKQIETKKKDGQPEEKVEFNQLVVPSGKRSFLALSDGTQVWVNANTRVVYPVVFDEKHREIFVDGEVYLDVFPDKSRPFTVKTKKLDVNVLGTSFNVSAYETEKDIAVVLVTGKVNVKTKDNQQAELKPNQMLSYVSGHTTTSAVDVKNYISWKDGVYVFDNEQFSVVLDKLSKYYGRKIVYGKDAAALRCSGTLNLRDDIMLLLRGLESTVPVFFVDTPECIKVYVKS